MRYKVIEATSLKDLSDRVELALSEGWRLAGGVAVHYGNVVEHNIVYPYKFYQAVCC